MRRLSLLLLICLLALPSIGMAPTRAQGEATPDVAAAGDVVIERLASVTLPAAAMPPLPAVFDMWTISHFTDAGLTYPSSAPLVSVAADVVLEGAYTARSEGAMQVQHEGALEAVPTGTEVALGPGDAVIYVDNSAAQEVRNPGDALTRVLGFGIFPVEPPMTSGVGAIDSNDWERSSLAEGDVAVAVERVTVPPGESLPAYVPDVRRPRVHIVEDGRAEWRVADADGLPVADGAVYGQGQAIWFRTLAAGQELVVRNHGEEPLVLLQLSLTPGEPAAP